MTQKFSCAPIANNRPWRAAVGRSSDDPNVFSHVQNRARIQDVEDIELPLHPEPSTSDSGVSERDRQLFRLTPGEA